MTVPSVRIRCLNGKEPVSSADYVLYWMVAFRRLSYNFALQRAVEWATKLGKPLVILEPLRVDYPWASDRFHAFITGGMRDNASAAAHSGVTYYPYLELSPGAGKGLVAALAAQACAVVTDDYPAFFIPRAIEIASARFPVLTEAVDSNGILPVRIAGATFPSAYAFRRFLQRTLPEHVEMVPVRNPLESVSLLPLKDLPTDVLCRWPRTNLGAIDIGELPVDHAVCPTDQRGGTSAATDLLGQFISQGLRRYAASRNDLADPATSGLSPYLHFGHISTHEIFLRVAASEDWSPERLSPNPAGKRSGWWGMGEDAEAFLDQLITWRELGFNQCASDLDYDSYNSLPTWAIATLEEHAGDDRPALYGRNELETAQTHDALWNAAQRQLVREGRVHNYLRMLWGKKILEWTAHPREALATMIDLNNKYALDGRDPNSYSGIFWCLGRYDRPWPERSVFGKVRYMSSARTARKLDVDEYLRSYSA